MIINFTVFEHVIIPDNIQNLKFYQGSSKNMNDNMMFCTKNKLLTQKNCTQGFIILNFLLVQTAVKLRNSLMYESCKLWYSLNYFNFVQVFVRIFEKAEEYIIQKIFPEYMDPVTSRGWEKNVFAKWFCLFLKWKYFSDIIIEKSISMKICVVVLNRFMYISIIL